MMILTWVGEMHDQRVIGRSPLRRENAADRDVGFGVGP